jgi:predicted phage baseplate assembly protein
LAVYARPEAAIQATVAEPRRAIPVVRLESDRHGVAQTWTPRPDLLSSGSEATEFVVETEHDGTAFLRFGDDVHGNRPNEDTSFFATYRVGNGAAGSIGAGAIAHIVSNDSGIAAVTNPLPAQGGTEPESAEDIKRDAPVAWRTKERAVTEEDYAEVAGRHAEVQRAAASFRWTGSWHTVFLTVDRRHGREIDGAFEAETRRHMERFRMAGYDLEVDGPEYVPLSVSLVVCVQPDYFRAHVRTALKRVFSNGFLDNGEPALFHPDRFTFGQSVYMSTIIAAAQAVKGVASVVVDTFERLHQPDRKPLDDGFLSMRQLEVARLDNDPSFPERGVLALELRGGK